MVTPKQHRTELLKYVHRPVLEKVLFRPASSKPFDRVGLPALATLNDLALTDFIGELRRDPGFSSAFCQNGNTANLLYASDFCEAHIRKLTSRARILSLEISSSIAERFVRDSVNRFFSSSRGLLSAGASVAGIKASALAAILKIFGDARESSSLSASFDIATKSQALVNTLLRESTAKFKGIVFVEQRATARWLAHFINNHGDLKEKFVAAAFVGTSSSTKRDDFFDFSDHKEQEVALADFRSGATNLIVATTVLEEGIDLPECHIVICFDPPMNLKQFVQRRGRARKVDSSYIMILPEDDVNVDPSKWRYLEEVMREAYLKDRQAAEIAAEQENVKENTDRKFRVASTGALLTMNNAVQHLHQLCNVLKAGAYIDAKPLFTYPREEQRGTMMVAAEVSLPTFMPPNLRNFKSLRRWLTEKNARRDVAFQAYLSLYKAGLVNDNLLPLRWVEPPPMSGREELIRGVAKVRMDPWLESAKRMSESNKSGGNFEWRRFIIDVTGSDSRHISMAMLTAAEMPFIPYFPLYWSASTEYKVSIRADGTVSYSNDVLSAIQSINEAILKSAQPGRFQSGRNDFLAMFLPADLKVQDIVEFAKTVAGHTKITTLFQTQGDRSIDPTAYGVLHGAFARSIPLRFVVVVGEPAVIVTKLPKRRDFVHPLVAGSNAPAYSAETTALCLDNIFVEHLPLDCAIFGYLLPSILNRIECAMAAQELRTTALARVGMDVGWNAMVQQALTHGSAGEADNYERLEFLGDCVLKFLVTIQLLADNPLWPEGYLSKEKGKLVSNNRLAAANIQSGIYKYMNATKFTGAGWRARYVEGVLRDAAQQGDAADIGTSIIADTDSQDSQKSIDTDMKDVDQPALSMKMLADTVESLIGVCYLHSGFDGAQKCLEVFFPDQRWTRLSSCIAKLQGDAPKATAAHSADLEAVVGRSFTSKSLLQDAITHDSYRSPKNSSTRSYQQLEFLGDAVLDIIVTRQLFDVRPQLRHYEMDKMRDGLVTTSTLGFLSLDHAVLLERSSVADGALDVQAGTARTALWQFLRHGSDEVTKQQVAVQERYERMRDELHTALMKDGVYPWSGMMRLRPDKFFADMVESVIGAVYLDSKGSLQECEAFLERIGLLGLLERFARDRVRCDHPKNALQMEAVSERIEYVGGETEAGRWEVQVTVGGREVGAPGVGSSRLDAETSAAYEAVMLLRAGKAQTSKVEEAGQN